MVMVIGAILIGIAIVGVQRPPGSPAIDRPGAAAAAPRDLVRRTNQELLDAIWGRPFDAGVERRVAGILDRATSFDRLAADVVGPHCPRWTDAQCADMKRAFARFVRTVHVKRMGSQQDVRFRYLSEEVHGSRAVVRSIVYRGGHRSALDYVLERIQGRWVIVNYIVDGINAAANYRSQFEDLLARGTVESILQRLEARIARLQQGTTPAKD